MSLRLCFDDLLHAELDAWVFCISVFSFRINFRFVHFSLHLVFMIYLSSLALGDLPPSI